MEPAGLWFPAVADITQSWDELVPTAVEINLLEPLPILVIHIKFREPRPRGIVCGRTIFHRNRGQQILTIHGISHRKIVLDIRCSGEDLPVRGLGHPHVHVPPKPQITRIEIRRAVNPPGVRVDLRIIHPIDCLKLVECIPLIIRIDDGVVGWCIVLTTHKVLVGRMNRKGQKTVQIGWRQWDDEVVDIRTTGAGRNDLNRIGTGIKLSKHDHGLPYVKAACCRETHVGFNQNSVRPHDIQRSVTRL